MTAQSKRLYVALAGRYAEKKPEPAEGAEVLAMWTVMVLSAASVLKEGNSAFDRAKFLVACGVEGKVVAALG